MRTTKLLVALVALITIGTANSFAQRGMGRGAGQGYGLSQTEQQPFHCNRIPNLTQEQSTQIEALRVTHLKEVTDLRNQMNEKRARLRTLESADKPNLNEINKTIDEHTAIKANLMKKRAAHRTEVSNLLTDEQRVYFNSTNKGKRNGDGRGQRGNRNGRGGRGCRMMN
ncbi:MAG: periplasmic heavy metal sensor [Bacteroidales bacterium]|nr:periplasmic heavy metal sensor [Bacteroidales bacterium]MBN2750240.1 periplasmic heavy metal sensor [Bacteroidales bacterium]